jgi:serine/threonine-protein kinase
MGVLGLLALAVPARAQPPAGEYPYFPPDSIWTQDITNAPVDPESATVINDLVTHGIWTNESSNPPGRIQIDFDPVDHRGMEVLEVDFGNAPASSSPFVPTDDWFSGDCDDVPIPVPAGGAIEWEQGYECLDDGDCHLLVVDRRTDILYEMWRANIVPGDNFYGGCLAVWDLRNTYLPAGRGHGCSSADAAGFPIAPLLFNADEVAAGHIDHAIRFILPNARIRANTYVSPATHSTGPPNGALGNGSTTPYGARFRLRADFPLNTLPNDGARTIAKALQKYGMFLSDGGSIALVAQSDRFTTAKWATVLGGNSRALSKILASDFVMVAGGTRFALGDCERTFPIFNDAFEVPSTLTVVSKWNGKTP